MVKTKKGTGLAGAFISALVILFVVITLWNIFSPVVGQINDITGDMITDLNNSEATATHDKIMLGWNAWPIVMVVGVVLFIIARAVFGESM